MTMRLQLFEAIPGKTIRVLLRVGPDWRGVIWLQVKKDGSLYVSQRLSGPVSIKQGKSHAPTGSAKIGYGGGTPVTKPSVVANPKVSFHASGRVNLGDQVLRCTPLTELTQLEKLCSVLFQHPTRYAIVPPKQVRKFDVCLTYPLEEACPLIGYLFVAPGPALVMPEDANAKYTELLTFKYPGLLLEQGLLFVLMLMHGLEGPWPPESYFVVRQTENASAAAGPHRNPFERTAP